MLPDPPVLLITDRAQIRGAPRERTTASPARSGRTDVGDALVRVALAACAGGCRWLSLREKDLPQEAQAALFATLRAATAPFGARLMLHGPAELAHAFGVDGVHLPDGADAARARRLLGPGVLVGLSVHTLAGAAAVDVAAVDYITASPVFLTASKPGYGPALGIEGLAAFADAVPVPVVALGGIAADTAAACRAAGASGLAIMGGIMRAEDPASAFAAVAGAFARSPVIRSGA